MASFSSNHACLYYLSCTHDEHSLLYLFDHVTVYLCSCYLSSLSEVSLCFERCCIIFWWLLILLHLSTKRWASLISLAFSVSSFMGCSSTSPFLMMMQFQVRRSSKGTNHTVKLSRDRAARNTRSVRRTRSRPAARTASSESKASVSSADVCRSISCTSSSTPFPAPGLQSLKSVKGRP